MEPAPQPKNVNSLLGKKVSVFVKEQFPECNGLTYIGEVIDILSQGVTLRSGEGETIDHIPWSNIKALRHSSHLIPDIKDSAAIVEATVG